MHSPNEFVGQRSRGATHTFSVQSPYMHSSSALHLDPSSPQTAIWTDDRADGGLIHFVLESPMMPNIDGDSTEECEEKRMRK
jgi:hypothetical protein